jgi:hypothetical protein
MSIGCRLRGCDCCHPQGRDLWPGAVLAGFVFSISERHKSNKALITTATIDPLVLPGLVAAYASTCRASWRPDLDEAVARAVDFPASGYCNPRHEHRPALTETARFSCYRGSLGPTNWVLIQPLKRSLSTCTQSALRFITLKRVPLGGVPTTVAAVEGADLMLTPGRCTKAISWFCDGGIVWRGVVSAAGAAAATWGDALTGTEGATAAIWEEGSTVTQGGGSGRATTVAAAGDGSATRGAV